MLVYTKLTKADGDPIPGPPIPEQAPPPPHYLDDTFEQLFDLDIPYPDVKLKLPYQPLAGHHVVYPVVQHAYLHTL